MNYPYTCPDCGPFDVEKPMSAAQEPGICPDCGAAITEQDFGCKGVGGYVSTEANWSGGKIIPQLGAGHPDRYVTSERQMARVYRKHGINMDTGNFVSAEAQIKATVPRKRRTGQTPGVVANVDID